MVDTISSLASIDYRHDDWGVDVTVGGSQKGLMLPPGLGFNAVGDKALAAGGAARLPRGVLGLAGGAGGQQAGPFPLHPGHQPVAGLARIHRHAGGGRPGRRCSRATTGWPRRRGARSAPGAWKSCAATRPSIPGSLTAVLVPDGCDADALRQVILEHFNMSLGNGLGKLQGRVFRIGHLGDFNELMLAGTLAGIEMGLALAQVPFAAGGVQAALDHLAAAAAASQPQPLRQAAAH